MKIHRAVVFAGTSLLIGCAGNVDGQGLSERTSASAQSLTLTQCASQRDLVLGQQSSLRVVHVPGAVHEVRRHGEQRSARTGQSGHLRRGRLHQCRPRVTNAATTAAGAVACATTEAECVASRPGALLPSIVTGTATCVETA